MAELATLSIAQLAGCSSEYSSLVDHTYGVQTYPGPGLSRWSMRRGDGVSIHQKCTLRKKGAILSRHLLGGLMYG